MPLESRLFWLSPHALKRTQLKPATNILFIGNVGEEGEGNLRGMRHLFAASPWRDAIRSLLVIDGAGTDTYVNQALGSRRFEITFRGPGGHSWSDFGVPNPIILLSRALARFSEVPGAGVAAHHFQCWSNFRRNIGQLHS